MMGYDLDFFTVDATISCWLRSVDTTEGPLLILAQVSDYDREEHEPALMKLIASIRWQEAE
jgi:hypothetical protein